MKKLIAIAISLTVVALVAGPGPAQGATLEELQAQIATLQAQLTAAMAQLTALGGTTTGGAAPALCTGITFTRALSQGMSGTDVKCLQALLNTAADTQVAATGVGSAGMETDYFGGLTKAAVATWQTKFASEVLASWGLTAGTGYFGTTSMAKANALLAGGVTPVTPVTPGQPTTGCNGEEGSYTVALASTPITRTLNGGVGLEAYGIDVSAHNSTINIGRVDLQVTSTIVGGAVTNPSSIITGIKVYKNSVSDANLVKTFTNTVFTQDSANLYYAQLTGLIFSVADGATEKLLIVADTGTSFDTNRTLVFNVYGTSGIRGTDCAGINSYVALATTRTLTIRRPGTSTLTMSTTGANPASDNHQSDTTSGVSGVTVIAFKGTSSAGTSTLTRLTLNYTTGASELIPSIVYLTDASDNVIATATPNATQNGTATFENFTHVFEQDVPQDLKIKADWVATTDSSIRGFTPNIPTTAATCMFQRSDGSAVNTTINTAIAGNTQYIMDQGVEITFVSAEITQNTVGTDTSVGRVVGTIKFKIKPFGGTLSQIVHASQISGVMDQVWVDALWASGTGITTSGSTITVSSVVAQDNGAALTEGEEATVTVTTTVTSDSDTYGANLRFKLEGITWYNAGSSNLQIYQGNGSGGNLTDSWATPWTFLDGR